MRQIGGPKKENRISTADLTFISLLCSICSVIRIIFHYIPHVAPFTAVIIIIGSYLGPYYGLTVGTLAVFISNFILTQGPWTPFQIVGMAIIGYFSGVIFKGPKKILLAMCAWGFVCATIYGVILTFYELVFAFAGFDLSRFSSMFFISFFSNGIYHTVVTVLFLFFFSGPIGKILTKNEFKK